MALFVLICIDKPDSLALRMATREAHFDYVRANPGVARLGGPFLSEGGDMAGSLHDRIEAREHGRRPGRPATLTPWPADP